MGHLGLWGTSVGFRLAWNVPRNNVFGKYLKNACAASGVLRELEKVFVSTLYLTVRKKRGSATRHGMAKSKGRSSREPCADAVH